MWYLQVFLWYIIHKKQVKISVRLFCWYFMNYFLLITFLFMLLSCFVVFYTFFVTTPSCFVKKKKKSCAGEVTWLKPHYEWELQSLISLGLIKSLHTSPHSDTCFPLPLSLQLHPPHTHSPHWAKVVCTPADSQSLLQSPSSRVVMTLPQQQ